MFTPRYTIPEAGNIYYNTAAKGGVALVGLLGKPENSGCNVLANCVGYAAGRFNEIIGKKSWDYFKYPPNAELFPEAAAKDGLKMGDTPKLGAVIVWEGIGSAAGHVAIVEDIKNDGSIITSESGYNCSNPFWTTHRYKEGGNWGQNTVKYKFRCFIYQPEIIPVKVIKMGDQGEEVELMQARLHALGYMRKNEIDGDFGKITLGAVCAFQLLSGLQVDGVCGPETQRALAT